MPVLINSVPKCGTHLLVSVLMELGLHKRDDLGLTAIQRFRTKGQALLDFASPFKVELDLDDVGRKTSRHRCESRLNCLGAREFGMEHLPYSSELENVLKQKDIRTLCIVREPKAVLWSWYCHMLRFHSYPFHEEMTDPLRTLEEKLSVPLTGTRKGRYVLAPLLVRYRRFLGWKNSSTALWIRFEDLIGPQGGGSEDAQIKNISRIADFLELDVEVKNVAPLIFGKNSWTYRAGRIDDWVGKLPETIITRIDQEFSEIYEQL